MPKTAHNNNQDCHRDLFFVHYYFVFRGNE
jgi:hypothetical protein